MVVEAFAHDLLTQAKNQRNPTFARHAKIAFLANENVAEAYDAEISFHGAHLPEHMKDYELELHVYRYVSDLLKKILAQRFSQHYPYSLAKVAQGLDLTRRIGGDGLLLRPENPLEHLSSQPTSLDHLDPKARQAIHTLWNRQFNLRATQLARNIQPTIREHILEHVRELVANAEPQDAFFFERVGEELMQVFSPEYFPTLMHALRLKNTYELKS